MQAMQWMPVLGQASVVAARRAENLGKSPVSTCPGLNSESTSPHSGRKPKNDSARKPAQATEISETLPHHAFIQVGPAVPVSRLIAIITSNTKDRLSWV